MYNVLYMEGRRFHCATTQSTYKRENTQENYKVITNKKVAMMMIQPKDELFLVYYL